MTKINSRGFSSLIVVGLVIALALGLSGLWYLNSQKVLDVSEKTEDSMIKGTAEESVFKFESSDVTELEVDDTNNDADLQDIEKQLETIESSYEEGELDDLTY